MKDIGPREFLSYIANAEYVVASSFHATAFSIIFEKKLLVISHSQTGSRTTDLLNLMGLGSCSVKDVKEIDNIDWDYQSAEKVKTERIVASKEFLKNALT